MPVDDEGNRAEIIMDGLSTIKRMNPSRLIEQYINASSRKVTDTVRQMVVDKATKAAISEYLLGYYTIVNADMVPMVTSDDGLVRDDHIQSVLDEGVYLWVPTNNKAEVIDIIQQLRVHYPATMTPVTYRGASGQMVRTKRPILIGSMYLMLLEKTGGSWAGVSTSKLSIFGVPAKLTSMTRHLSPGREQPIRFGESEGRLFVSTCGGMATADLFDRTNNNIVRKEVARQILMSNKPTDIKQLVDRRRYPSGQSRILQTIRHFGQCDGWVFKRITDL